MDWSGVRAAVHNGGDGWGLWLLDKDMNPIADLHGALSIELPEAVNETTACKIEIRGDHPAAKLILPLDGANLSNPSETWNRLVDDAQWIMAEGPGGETERLVYRVARVTDKSENHGPGRITIEGKSLYRYVEKIACRADPASPLIAQLRYRDFRAGDSLRVIKEYLLVNLMRDFQPRAITGWDLWSSTAWRAVSPTLWPAIVNPVHKSTSTQATVLDARFDMAADLFKETLNAAGLMLTVNLWLEGDKQPAQSHMTLSAPTLLIDVVPRQFDTSTTGGALDVLRGVVRSFDRDRNAPKLGLGDTPSTASGLLPWVVWRPEDMAGITSEFTVVKSEDWHVTVGGRSPEVLNKFMAAGTKSLFQGLAAALSAAFPPFAPLIAAAGAFLGDVVGASLKDKLFAWNEFTDAVRREAHGRFAYRDAVGSGDGWTLSAWQQGFQMLAQGAGMVSVGFQSSGASPYEWGRDFRAGDQQGLLHRGVLFATYVHSVTLKYQVGKGWSEELTLGDPRARESFVRGATRSIKGVKNAVDRVKSFIM